MDPATNAGLLHRLQTDPRPTDWGRLDDVYRPWLRLILSRDPTLGDDAEDVVQDAMVYLIGALADFRHSGRPGSFRAWLRAILHRRLQAYYRQRRQRNQLAPDHGSAFLAQLADPASALNQDLDREEKQFVLKRLMGLMDGEFNADHLRIFRRVVFEGAKPADVAAEEAVSVAAVHTIKSRVLGKLREEASKLLD